MKVKVLGLIFVLIMLGQWLMTSCGNRNTETLGDEAIKKFYFQQTDSLLAQLARLDSFSEAKQPVEVLQKAFADSRFMYKKIEAIVEYYFQGLTKRVNGPALPDVKTEDGQVWPPHGFQVLEQILYSGYNNSLQSELSGEIKLLQTDLRFMRENMVYHAVNGNQINEMIQHQFIRIATWGITGFDAPLSKLSLQEATYSLFGIQQVGLLYNVPQKKGIEKQIAIAINYLKTNQDFDRFNRLEFITTLLMPLSELYENFAPFDKGIDSLLIKPFRGTLSQLMKGSGFNADYYSGYAIAKTNADKVILGKRLFFDNRLSKSGTISCGTCHQPNLYFTDGKVKAGNFVHGGNLLRNTPTLYYAALQSHQFYDIRSITLEDQANEVMQNKSEFNFSSGEIAQKLFADKEYAKLFKKAFNKKEDTISGYEVRNVLAAYVRSLSPFTSAFDEYLQGNKTVLTKEQIMGFNLFAGKAKCATCHFVPLFNGNIPPWFSKSESEIIGVPTKTIWQKATIDADSGRYKINPMKELLFAFKTPTVRNIEKTGPYMHNGVYKTLNDVVTFYQKGGGVGLGINLPFQSLPFDSLSLNQQEKNAIVAFMQSLTDKKVEY